MEIKKSEIKKKNLIPKTNIKNTNFQNDPNSSPEKNPEFNKKKPKKNFKTIKIEKNFLEKKIIKNFSGLKISNLLKTIGSQNNYQKKLLILSALIIYLNSIINYFQPYIFETPTFLCPQKNGIFEKCSEKIACENFNGFFEILKNRQTLVTKYGLYCDRGDYVFFIQTFIFFFGAILAFIFNYLSDGYSRRKILIFSAFLLVLGCFLCFLDQLGFIVLGLILEISGIDLVTSMFYIYFNESMSDELRNQSSGLTFLAFVFGSYSLAFFCLFIRSYWDLFLIALITSFFVIFAFYYFFEETPFLLYNKANIYNLFENLKKISKINHTPSKHRKTIKTLKKIIYLDPNIKITNSLKTLKATKKKVSIKEKLKKNLKNILLCSILTISIYFSSGMFLIAPQYMGIKNIFINITIPNIGEMIGYYTMSIFSEKHERKKIFKYFFYIFYIFCSILFLFTFLQIRNFFFIQILETFISFILKMNTAWGFAIIFTYISEIFETEVRGFALGFAILAGRISVSFCAGFVFWGRERDLHPLVFCAVFAGFAQVAIIWLPETFGKEVMN